MNKLFYGDNLEVLRRYVKDESVDLCYIDPPFNSKRNYNQIYNNIGQEDKAQAQAFIDTWTWDDHANQGLLEIQENYLGHFTSQTIDLINGLIPVLKKSPLFAYLVGMTLRIAEIHRVLKPTGSFYLHCDPNASHYLKIILDSIFCAQGGDFINELVWTYDSAGRATKNFHKKHDTIFLYVKNSKKWTFNGKVDGVGVPRKASNHMKLGTDELGREYYEKKDKASGKVYRWYLDENKIRNDWWDDITALNGEPADVIYINALNREDRERLGYPTQKPEALLERIIKASSNENDVILDAFCGCGTTVSVAQRLNRQWIGIDITYQSISLILKRLEDSFGEEVLNTIQLNGIPKDMEAATSLALKKDDRTRKEFEKWAVLTYSNNRGIINDKKGKTPLNPPLLRGGGGFDGIAYFQGEKDREKIILQVKSGKVGAKDIRDLQGVLTLENGAIGIFITLQKPTKDMITTAKSAGIYQNKYMSQPLDKIQIVTIEEMLEQQKRLDIKLSFEVLKSAEKQQQIKADQMKLEL